MNTIYKLKTNSEEEDIFLTPQEILDKYPDIRRKFNWSASDIGILLKCRVLEGYYDRGKRISLIKESSIKQLIEYINGRIQSQMICLH